MITVLGIGEDGLAGLSEAAKSKISDAEVLIGGKRHHNFAPDFSGETFDWSNGIEAVLDNIETRLDKNIVVLASGDPLYFGVGKNIIDRFGAARVQVFPVAGAVSLTCAAMGWSQPDVQVLTLHGRPLENLNLYLSPGARLVVLTQDGDTPAHVAKLLSDQGYGPSIIWVLEHLGGVQEDRLQGVAARWAHPRCADLNTLAIEVVADETARPLTRLAGLPDDAFEHDGQITKRAVRAVTLSSLAPKPGEVLWDFGAGAGSICSEWMRAHPSCQAIAVERDLERADRILQNAKTLGVPKLIIKVGENQDVLDQLLDAPDAIFIGGGVSPELVDAAWARLKPQGRLVANAVTDNSREILNILKQKYDGEQMEISIEGKLPITQIILRKKL